MSSAGSSRSSSKSGSVQALKFTISITTPLPLRTERRVGSLGSKSSVQARRAHRRSGRSRLRRIIPATFTCMALSPDHRLDEDRHVPDEFPPLRDLHLEQLLHLEVGEREDADVVAVGVHVEGPRGAVEDRLLLAQVVVAPLWLGAGG